MARVHVSIGSNVDRAANIRAGVGALRSQYGDLQLSSVYDTPAVGFAGDNFYNLVAGFDTGEDVHRIAGRLRDDLVIDEAGLRLPRSEILRYAFVLGPLAEIAGGRRHPVLRRTFGELWQAFDKSGEPLRAVRFDWNGRE